ncbi:MAG: DUF1549 domain-containing protein [Planctomycetaceae bacterium]
MTPREQLFYLVNLQIEDRLSSADEQQLAALLNSDADLVRDYTRLLCLHAQLHWDAGMSPTPAMSAAEPAQPTHRPSASDPRRTSAAAGMTAVASAVLALAGIWMLVRQSPQPQQQVVKNTLPVIDEGTDVPQPHHDMPAADPLKAEVAVVTPVPLPVPVPLQTSPPQPADVHSSGPSVAQNSRPPAISHQLPDGFSDQHVVDAIDRLLAKSWHEQKIQPVSMADDAEWVRRIYLTFLGRIPTLHESEAFLSDNSPRKHAAAIERLSATREQAENLAVIWTNLLVGRTERSGVNRDKLFEFLTGQFADDRPWMQTVSELITATGRNDENGATNFLLAHLNNEATPATAVTARLFLGEQISCVQCHDHPFANGLKQHDYWALNAFFKSTDRVTVAFASAQSEIQDVPWKLVDRPIDEPMTYYENRSGVRKATLPAYDGHVVHDDAASSRRQALAELLETDSEYRVARAMVNRMWAHFFGYGFTGSVDDMSPHVPVSHPELLQLLAEAFVRSDYSVRRLMTWIGRCQAWQLSSQVADSESADDPAVGDIPSFSRVYVRRMTPEQVYESIRIAIRSTADQPTEQPSLHTQHRRDWVRQFATAYDTDENDESLDFEGTIPQALVMMNGVDVDEAIHQVAQTLTGNTGRLNESATGVLDRVSLSLLTRHPTSKEEEVFRSHYRRLARKNPTVAMPSAIEDMMWAYLNSSEFVMIH